MVYDEMIHIMVEIKDEISLKKMDDFESDIYKLVQKKKYKNLDVAGIICQPNIKQDPALVIEPKDSDHQ